MNKIFSLLLLILVVNTFSFAQSLSTGLVGYWPFDGSHEDKSSNKLTTYNNGAILTSDRFGNLNYAYNFADKKEIGVSNINIDMSASVSLVGWFKTNDNNLNGEGGSIVSLGEAGLSRPAIYQRKTDIWVNYGNGEGYLQKTIYNKCNDDNWHCFIYVSNGNNKNAQIYIDGRLMLDYRVYTNRGNSPSLKIGGANSSYTFNGSIDDIRIYNRALSLEEISSLYTQGICKNSINVTDTLFIRDRITAFNPVAYLNTIKIFPNPTNDYLNFDFGENFKTMEDNTLDICNSVGQIIYSGPVNKQTLILNMGKFASRGLYSVNIFDKNKIMIHSRKIVLE